MKIFLLLVLVAVLSACASFNDGHCRQISCSTGGIVFYPHEHPCDRPPSGQHYRLDSLELRC